MYSGRRVRSAPVPFACRVRSGRCVRSESVMGSHLYKLLFLFEILLRIYGPQVLIAHFKVQRRKIAGVLLP